MNERPHVIGYHIELDGERYVLLDANPEQALMFLHKDHRTKAFAAIRRAAALAREMEASALIAPDPYDQELWAKARGVRLAIRAAIGSEKS